MIFKKIKVQRYKNEKKEWSTCLVPQLKTITILYENTRDEVSIFPEAESSFVRGYLKIKYPKHAIRIIQENNCYHVEFKKNNSKEKEKEKLDKQKMLEIIQKNLSVIQDKGQELKKIGCGVLVALISEKDCIWAELGQDFNEAFFKSLGKQEKENDAFSTQMIYSSESYTVEQMTLLLDLGFSIFLTRKGCSENIINLAHEKGASLVGFVRNNRFSFF